MPRQLTVLGCQASYPTLGHPCSGYLLELDSFNVLVDLGYSTLERLLSLRPNGDVDAIIITHEHPDHCLDLHGLFRLHYYGRLTSKEKHPRKLPLVCTPGVIEKMHMLEPTVDLNEIFEVQFLADKSTHTLGPLKVTGFGLHHHVPDVGIRLDVLPSTPGGNPTPLLAFTGDTGPVPALQYLARDIPFLLCDSTDKPGEAERPLEKRRLMCSGEAGHWATKANAKRLMLTHFWPGNDPQVALNNAQAEFKGEIIVAEPGMVVPLGD